MTPVKKSVIEMIERLPDECTLDDIQYHLYVRQKVERGLKDVEQGNVVSHEEAERRMNEWLESIGRKKQ